MLVFQNDDNKNKNKSKAGKDLSFSSYWLGMVWKPIRARILLHTCMGFVSEATKKKNVRATRNPNRVFFFFKCFETFRFFFFRNEFSHRVSTSSRTRERKRERNVDAFERDLFLLLELEVWFEAARAKRTDTKRRSGTWTWEWIRNV